MRNVELTNETWTPDEDSPNCEQCGRRFTLIHRIHHCRLCGQSLCFKCNDHWVKLPNHLKPEKDKSLLMSPVCHPCHLKILGIDAEVHHESFGSQRGIPLIIVNNELVARTSLRKPAAQFAAMGFHVVVPELPGFGSRYDEVMSEENALRALCEACELASNNGRAHFVGISMGGSLTLKFLHAFPERVCSVTLMASTCENSGIAKSLAMGIVDGAFKVSSRNMLIAVLWKQLEQSDLSAQETLDMLEWGFTFQHSAGCNKYLLPSEVPFLEICRSSPVPMFFINAEHDSTNTKEQDNFINAAKSDQPSSVLYVIPNCSKEALLAESHIADVVEKTLAFCSDNLDVISASPRSRPRSSRPVTPPPRGASPASTPKNVVQIPASSPSPSSSSRFDDVVEWGEW